MTSPEVLPIGPGKGAALGLTCAGSAGSIQLFDAVSMQPDMEYAMVDATIVRVHRHGQGAKGGLRARP